MLPMLSELSMLTTMLTMLTSPGVWEDMNTGEESQEDVSSFRPRPKCRLTCLLALNIIIQRF